ncbi:MAG: phage portal protein [Acidobacteria bacterium]|nr:phage portal protein [Acidobacteriota bacterium]
MRIPFLGRKEKRQGDYTQALIDRLIQANNGYPAAKVGATAAAAIAGGTISRAFAAGRVEPSMSRTGLDPSVLARIGSSLLYFGEAVWVISVENGMVRLYEAASWSIEGDGPDEATWRYYATLNGPTSTRQVSVPGEAVLHPRVNCTSSEPHRGRSPLALAGVSGEVLANAATQMRDEFSGPTGRLIPAPLDQMGGEDEDGNDPLDSLVSAISGLKGKAVLAPSMSREWAGGGSGGSTFTDWQSRRLGAEPPKAAVDLMEQTHNSVLAAAGIPPQLFSVGSQAQSVREAMRGLLHLSIAPMARILETEATAKMETEVKIDFQALHAADVQGRARAFQSMVGGGMDVAAAATASGILQPDD